jgi:hypothetical protein
VKSRLVKSRPPANLHSSLICRLIAAGIAKLGNSGSNFNHNVLHNRKSGLFA